MSGIAVRSVVVAVGESSRDFFACCGGGAGGEGGVGRFSQSGVGADLYHCESNDPFLKLWSGEEVGEVDGGTEEVVLGRAEVGALLVEAMRVARSGLALMLVNNSCLRGPKKKIL